MAAGCVRLLMPRFDTAQIAGYYDRHTPVFVRFGQGGGTGAIHRAVWAPGVACRHDAFHFVDDRLAELARWAAPAGRVPHVVDLGCGVGASLCYLAHRLPIRGTGITISAVQARLAAERVREAGLSDRIVCLHGDYCDLPDGIEPADLAFAIEAFVHGPSPERFFAEAAALVRPGGALVICDDFRRPPAGREAARTIDRFVRGWQINTLLERDELRRLAHAAGFDHESTTDLTPWLDTRRPRDRVIGALAVLIGWLPVHGTRVGWLLGGSALQTCLERGWIGYDLVVFRRRA